MPPILLWNSILMDIPNYNVSSQDKKFNRGTETIKDDTRSEHLVEASHQERHDNVEAMIIKDYQNEASILVQKLWNSKCKVIHVFSKSH
jgi:hypothetical protein